MSEITMVLTQDQLDSIADQQAGSGGDTSGGDQPWDQWTDEELFGEGLSGDYYATSGSNTDPMSFDTDRARVRFTVTKDMIGERFGCTERYSGAGNKTCKLFLNDVEVSRMNVGTGKLFQVVITEAHVGDGRFDYSQTEAGKAFESGLEMYSRP